jgi:hypothetical protein
MPYLVFSSNRWRNSSRTSALTPRNIIEDDIKVVAGFLHRVIQLSIVLQKEVGSKMLKDFIRVATTESEGKVGAQMVREAAQGSRCVRSEVVPSGCWRIYHSKIEEEFQSIC